MSSTQSRRINPALLRADLDAQVALASISDYKPANPDFSLEIIQEALQAVRDARDGEILAQTAVDTARDAAAAAEWRFHEVMLGVKDQIIAQYGKNSDQVQALGLKKKMEYKRPVRAAKAA
jgi:hypothetical protein